MRENERLNLDFVEGLIIGIYGNWLIALIDKIDYVKIQIDGFLFLIVSFGALGLYFFFLLSGRVQTSFRKNVFLVFLHYSGWLYVYTTYGNFQNLYEEIAFSFIGLILFALLNLAENRRIRG